MADKADRIITMLPSSPNVIDVYTGPNGILKYPIVFLTFIELCLRPNVTIPSAVWSDGRLAPQEGQEGIPADRLQHHRPRRV